MTQVVIHDESIFGETIRELIVEIPSEQITVSELIRSRVYQEAKEHNARLNSIPEPPLQFQPTETEIALNGPRGRQPAARGVAWKDQFAKAVDAFRANRILILIDDQQVTSLDDQIEINSTTEIRFLRLTMLMGG